MTYGTALRIAPPALADPPSAPSVTPRDDTIYLPNVFGGKAKPVKPATYPAGMNADAWSMAQLWMRHPGQQRGKMYYHASLTAACKYRAHTMMAENHFDHTSLSGETPNEVVADYFGVPFWYPRPGNSVEVLGQGYDNAGDMVKAIMALPDDAGHKMHFLGSHEGFAAQRWFGVWCERNQEAQGYPWGETTYSTSWVLISAHQ